MAKIENVDDYLASVSDDRARACLSHLRDVIRKAAPEAEECIRYGIPTYKQNGFVISFAAFKNHCSLFPGHTVADFADRLKGFKLVKGTVQFPFQNPPSDALVAAMVKARVAENLG